MVMYDELGNPVWYYANGTTAETRGDVPAIYLDNGDVGGDADRLANGNILVAAGVRDAVKQSRVFEVRRADGQVVWELRLPADNGCFRAQRISPPPLVERLN